MSAFDPKRTLTDSELTYAAASTAKLWVLPLSIGSFQQLRCSEFSAFAGAAMRRRDFIKGLVGSTASWPLSTYAQQSATPVVGFLHSGIEEQAAQLTGFKKGLDVG